MIEFEGIRKVRPRISIAPLIDVVFLLLIFFLLSSHFVSDAGIKLSLPYAQSAAAQEGSIVISIDEANTVYLGKDAVAIDALKTALSARIAADPALPVIVKADKKIDLGLAVRVMDIARQAGAKALVVTAQKNDEQ